MRVLQLACIFCSLMSFGARERLKRRTGDASFEDFQHTLHKDNFFNNVVVAPSTKTNHVRFSQESDRGETDNEVSTRESLASELYTEDEKRKKQLLHMRSAYAHKWALLSFRSFCVFF